MLRKLSIIISLMTLIGCSSSEDTTPSYADTDRLEGLIDQNIPKVMDFKSKYGTYILYQFDKTLDFAYQFEQATSWQNASLGMMNHSEAADAVDLLYDKVFPCYSDDFKTNYFPRKLLLVNSIASSDELGMSIPKAGQHSAVANINSVTFACGANADIDAMHRALLADYMVKSRGEYPVEDTYFAYSQNDYAALMNSQRKTAAQLVAEDENFFYNHGFFFPADDESTYFPAAEEDLLAFIGQMVTMDGETANRLLDFPLIADKMHLLTVGLQTLGVDVMTINPNMEQFIKMEYVQPATMYANDVVTDNPAATVNVTILRGSHALDHLDVLVNGEQTTTIDLRAYDKMRVVIPVSVEGLVKGANIITFRLYEDGRENPSTIATAGVSYATLDQVTGFSIKCSDDHEDVSRTLRFYQGDGGILDDEQNPNLTTIAFQKHGYLDKYFMEIDAEYRFWKMYKKDGHVETIIEYLQDGFNEDYTAPLYRMMGTYTFSYNEVGELTSVTHADAEGKSKEVVTDVVYASGRMIRYTYEGRIYEPAYTTANGVTTRTDCLDAAMSGMQFGFDGTEALNPYYMPELPAVLPGSIAEIPLQLFYSQYLFNSLGNVWNSGWTRNLNDKVNYAEVTMGGKVWTYRFKLK